MGQSPSHCPRPRPRGTWLQEDRCPAPNEDPQEVVVPGRDPRRLCQQMGVPPRSQSPATQSVTGRPATWPQARRSTPSPWAALGVGGKGNASSGVHIRGKCRTRDPVPQQMKSKAGEGERRSSKLKRQKTFQPNGTGLKRHLN